MKKIKIIPKDIRKTILKMAYSGSSVHIGCALSLVEIFVILYQKFVKYPNNDPNHNLRDYIILSKGHGVMAQYACMNKLGWIKDNQINGYFSNGSLLKGLSDSRVDGLEVSSGSLGHGLSVACGIAMGLKINKSKQKIFCIVGDGEINEGAIWEAILFSSHHKLNNLIIIIDFNGYQALGKTIDIINLGNLKTKLTSFGLNVKSVDGHNLDLLEKSITNLIKNKTSTSVLVAKTIKGKGIPFMENNNDWHYRRLNQSTYNKAMSYLK